MIPRNFSGNCNRRGHREILVGSNFLESIWMRIHCRLGRPLCKQQQLLSENQPNEPASHSGARVAVEGSSRERESGVCCTPKTPETHKTHQIQFESLRRQSCIAPCRRSASCIRCVSRRAPALARPNRSEALTWLPLLSERRNRHHTARSQTVDSARRHRRSSDDDVVGDGDADRA